MGKHIITMHILSIISRGKGNQATKFTQLIEYNMSKIFLPIIMKKWDRETNFETFSFLKMFYIRSKQEVSTLILIYFGRPLLGHAKTNWTNCIAFQAVDPKLCSILTFYKRVLDQPTHHILCMIFQEKCFSCPIWLTGQISLCGSLYFLKFWAVCVLPSFVSQSVTS